MSDFFWKIAFGLCLFGFGLQIFIQPKWYAFLRQTYMDFGDGHKIWGIIWMLVAGFIICLSIGQKVNRKKKESPK